MDAVTATAEMTAAEFLALGLRPEGIVHQELIEGELVVNDRAGRTTIRSSR